MPKHRIIASVINNYQGDQRVQKQISSLRKFGFDTEVIATDLRGKPKMEFDYPTHILNLNSQEGMKLYFEFNHKLFWKLNGIVRKGDILLANDLDSLLPNYLISKMKGVSIVFDSHELFSELPSLNGRSLKKKMWKTIEAAIVPKMKHFYTVSKGYADWFENEYGNRPEIILNVPDTRIENKQTLNIKLPKIQKNEKILIYQGAINVSRGIDKMIISVQSIERVQLWIIGDGPKKQEYQNLTKDLNLNHKVKFFGAVSPQQLKLITPMADIGLSLEEDGGLSYRYALPNKIFDYMHAGVPILGTNLPDIKQTIESFGIGMVIQNHKSNHISDCIKQMLDEGKMVYTENLKNAASEFNWSNEEQKLKKIYSEFIEK